MKRALYCLLMATIGLGCAAPPDLPVGQLQARLVNDRTVHEFIQSYEVAVLSAVTTDEQSLDCDDFPSRFDLGDDLLEIEAFRSIEWDGSASEATVERLTVPADQSLLIVVRAFDGKDDDATIVARGCEDRLRFTRGSSPQRSVDVRAVTGAPCSSSKECERHLECQQGDEFPRGYCAKSCGSQGDCPTASLCIETDDGGLCARPCATGDDCEGRSSQACVDRQPMEGGCDKVCAYPEWNERHSC